MRLIFDFWKDNRLDNHFQLSSADLVAKFSAWKEYQINKNKERGQSWYNYYRRYELIMAFIGDKGTILGLESVFDEHQFDDLCKSLRQYL